MTPRIKLPCGTYAAYRRHLYRKEEPCPACQQARQDYDALRVKWLKAKDDRARDRKRLYGNDGRYRQDAYNLFKNHGLTSAGYAALRVAQENACYLCGDPLGERRTVAIDHDHRCCPADHSCSACRRGIACARCNKLIGAAGDDPALLRRITEALEAIVPEVEKRIAAKPRTQMTLPGMGES